MHTNVKENNHRSKRYHLLDAIKGVAITGVVLYHFLYDILTVYGNNASWTEELFARIWQEGTCFVFIAIAGFVWNIQSKSSLRRGLELNALGLVITLVTVLVIPAESIFFGILNFMGCANIILWLRQRWAQRVPCIGGMCASFFVFATCRQLAAGLWGLEGVFTWELPAALYQSMLLVPLGLPPVTFSSSDYFPLLPWLGAYFFGYYAYNLLKERELLGGVLYYYVPVLAPLGRRSLEIYLLHQPVLIGVIELARML